MFLLLFRGRLNWLAFEQALHHHAPKLEGGIAEIGAAFKEPLNRPALKPRHET